jgi:hypothetical protein
MDEFEEPIDEYDEYLASEDAYAGYLEDAEDISYGEEELVDAPAAPGNLLDYLLSVGMSLPVLAVVFIGVCLIFLTSFINYAQAAQFVGAQNLSTAAASINNADSLNLLAKKKAIAGGESLPGLFTPEVLYWKDKIVQWASDQGLDPRLVATVMQIESCGYSQAVSRSGAMGLFQVMPYHFQQGEDGLDPDTNALRGMAYLKQALNAHQGDVRLALAGYNAGITGSSQMVEFWPEETKRYVYWGTGIYADALAGAESSSRLQEWLGAGGNSLCRQASQTLELP